MSARRRIGAVGCAMAFAFGLAGCTPTVDAADLERRIEAMDTTPIVQAGSPGVTGVTISAFMGESVTLALTVDEDEFDASSLCRTLNAYVEKAPSWSTVVRVGAVDGTGSIVDFDEHASALGLNYDDNIRGVSAPWSDVERGSSDCP